MGQWGRLREFTRQHTNIVVMPYLDTGPNTFQPPAQQSKIVKLLLLNKEGMDSVATALLNDIAQKYKGKPYSAWLEDGMVLATDLPGDLVERLEYLCSKDAEGMSKRERLGYLIRAGQQAVEELKRNRETVEGSSRSGVRVVQRRWRWPWKNGHDQ